MLPSLLPPALEPWAAMVLVLCSVLASMITASLAAWLLVELPEWLWQLTIACFVLYLCWGPRLPRLALGVTGTFVAAALTSFASMFVGATGPLVAAFVKQVHSDRFATVATFAAAMTLQHAPKALVFGFAGFVFPDWLAFIAVFRSPLL